MRVTGTSMAIPRPVFLFSSFLDCVGINLVGGFNHLEKYEFVNGKDDNPYMKWKIKFIFETTNQIYYSLDQVLITKNHYSSQ